jgi:hypothetical protein
VYWWLVLHPAVFVTCMYVYMNLCMYECVKYRCIVNLLCILLLVYQHTSSVTCNTWYTMLSYIIYSPFFTTVLCICTKYYTHILICTNLNPYVLHVSCISVVTHISPPSLFHLNQLLKIKKKNLLVFRWVKKHVTLTGLYSRLESLPATLATLLSQEYDYALNIWARL